VTAVLPRFVSYLRVSTDGQGRSGLGIEAQRQAVAAHVAQASGEVVAEFQEVESGKRADRPQLAAALASCRTRRAVLIIAKLDRLARNARFLLSVVEGSGEAGVVFCDLPTLPAGPIGKFMLTQMAAVAELEAGLIGQRTRAALAVAKARGVRLGNPSPTPATAEMAAAARQARSYQVAARAEDVLAVVREVQAEGASSLRTIAAELHARGVLTPAGKAGWSPAQVQRLLKRENRGSIVESH
jgi:DNA invertase Pin-like site-specific DNA recombinase